MSTIPSILKLDSGGLPVSWITWQTAATLYARERVVWEAGEERFSLPGGTFARTGLQSQPRIGSIDTVADRATRFTRVLPVPA